MAMYEYSRDCIFKSIEDIKGKKVTIMGLGLNGGGEASARFFAEHGAIVTVTDMKSREALLPSIERLSDLKEITYVLGEHREQDFKDADCVIKNPGVKIEGNKYLSLAKAIETDVSIFLRFTSAPIIAVTGSKGKSSTVSAIYYGLTNAGYKAFLGGNITVSPLTFLEKTTSDTPVVLELSSWQLSDLRGRNILKPYISIITKIVPDHQNWYGNMEDYVQDKMLIYKGQSRGDWTIVDYDGDEPSYAPKNASSWGDLFASETKATVLRYSKSKPEDVSAQAAGNSGSNGKFYGVWEEKKDSGFSGKVLLPGMDEPVEVLNSLKVPGKHMRTNVLNAALVMYIMNVECSRIKEILGNWEGIPHRLNYFHSYKENVRFYNDTCATVPEAVCEATNAFERPVILLTGGTDKGLSFEPLVKHLSDSKNPLLPKKMFLLCGTGTDKLISGLSENKVSYEGPFENLDKMLIAVKSYIDGENISDSDVVFSPGATSFGLFKNEFDRGDQFIQKTREIFR